MIAQVLFLAVLTTIEHVDLHPLGMTPFPLWGNPSLSADHAYMATYSPYDHLQKVVYPALLAVGSVADYRVTFCKPLKFSVKARGLMTAGNPNLKRSLVYARRGGDPGAGAHRAKLASFMEFAVWSAEKRWAEMPHGT